jgi:hypothetical protein
MIAGRMTILVTLFLVLINIFNAITDNSPNVEGLSSISAWMMTCILFVFAAFFVYTITLIKKIRIVKVCLFHKLENSG